MIDDDENTTEVMVTVSFPLAINIPDDLGRRELATALRERWIDEPETLHTVVEDALHDDYDVSVRLFDEP